MEKEIIHTENIIEKEDSIIIISSTTRIIKRNKVISDYHRGRIFTYAKNMHKVAPRKRGSMENICKLFGVSEDDVHQILKEEKIKEDRFYHYWSGKIGEVIRSTKLNDDTILPDTRGIIQSVDDDGMINVLWDDGRETKVDNSCETIYRSW